MHHTLDYRLFASPQLHDLLCNRYNHPHRDPVHPGIHNSTMIYPSLIRHKAGQSVHSRIYRTYMVKYWMVPDYVICQISHSLWHNTSHKDPYYILLLRFLYPYYTYMQGPSTQPLSSPALSPLWSPL